MNPIVAHFMAAAGVAVLVGCFGSVQPAVAQGAGVFAGKSISATVNYKNRIRYGGREAESDLRLDISMTISGDGKVTGSVSRNSTNFRGQPIGQNRSISTQIGKPKEVRGSGHGVVVVSGNTLTVLRTWEVGGAKITITMQGGGRCTVTAPVMREVGAGTTKRDHVTSGTVEVLSSRQVGSSCSVR
jgi:hypothetical protein